MSKNRIVLSAGIAACLLAALLSLTMGAAAYTIPELLDALAEGTGSTAGRIFFFSRLPRTVGCLLAGAALAVSGCVIQSVLANPLASPGIIGVNAGAGLGVTICCALGALSGWAVAGAAFLGALSAVALVVFCAGRTGASRTTVILSGVAVNALLNGLRDGVTTLVPEVSLMSVDFRVGGFSAVVHTRLIPAGVLILAALALLFTMHNELDVMTLGEETARGLGMNVKQTRNWLLTLAALLAGAAVSFGGLLGFVGLIVPHAVRRVAGSRSQHLLGLCTLFGAAFVCICDTVARTAFSPYEIPVGIIMAFLGAPFFVFILIKGKGGHSGD